MPTEAEIIAAIPAPATVTTLRRQFETLGLTPGATTIVHSSLSALGWIAGGAHAVVRALLDAVGPTGTIVMPTHSGSTDAALWENPPVPVEWVEVIRSESPLFDPELTPSRAMGQIVECFRRHPEAVRSSHPSVSFAAVGPRAVEIVSDHPLAPSLGEDSPLGALYRADALVALIGVDHSNNTSMHLAEHRTEWVGGTSTHQGAAVLVDGVRTWVEFDDPDYDSDDFDQIGEAFDLAGFSTSGPVGTGRGIVCRQRDAVDFAAAWMAKHRPGPQAT
jgi:aminoglycoside 3-N-acetyltransferase